MPAKKAPKPPKEAHRHLHRHQRRELVERLSALARDMHETSAKMAEYLSFDPRGVQHANELAGAAEMAASWVKELRIPIITATPAPGLNGSPGK